MTAEIILKYLKKNIFRINVLGAELKQWENPNNSDYKTAGTKWGAALRARLNRNAVDVEDKDILLLKQFFSREWIPFNENNYPSCEGRYLIATIFSGEWRVEIGELYFDQINLQPLWNYSEVHYWCELPAPPAVDSESNLSF